MTQIASYRVLDPHFEPPLTENGQYMLRFRYLARREDGSLESPGELFRRVAWNLAAAERRFDPSVSDEEVTRTAEDFFRMMTEFRFLPNAPTLLGAGGPLQQLFACFVLPVEDSIAGIFGAVRMAAMVHASGGGTGFCFSHIRSRGTPVATGGVASGPVSFLRAFDVETDVVKSGGTGWGANMAVLRCDHPDILEFIRAKSSGGLKNFNLSVGVTDDFMARRAAGRRIPLVDPHTKEIRASPHAQEIFEAICEEAWRTGDPGLLFLDRIEASNPTPDLGRLEATNPCGEAPLLPFEACCLGGLNVSQFLNAQNEVAWDALAETVRLAVRMMDNVIEVSRFPLAEIGEAVRRTRKIGIGVMGFADLLLRLGIPYDSAEAEALAVDLMRSIQSTAAAASAELGAERGSFPAFDGSVWKRQGYRHMRNATTTSNAPNSTISVIAGCSAGIEPIFSARYVKNLQNGTGLSEMHPAAAPPDPAPSEAARREVVRTSPDAAEQRTTFDTARDAGSHEAARRAFRTAHDVSPQWHVRLQAAFQAHTDLGISKTVNLPTNSRPSDVCEAFLLAYDLGCKGVTCFRDGCRDVSFLELNRSVSASSDGCDLCT